MIFNSIAFLLFLPLVVGGYALLRGHFRAQNTMLLVASYVFYGWWDWRFLGLIAFSTVVDYVAARGMAKTEEQRKRRWLLLASLAANLGTLALFKYFGFFAESAVDLLHLFGFRADAPTLRVILPVGISFYTFQTLSYTIDVYRGALRPVRRFDDFALYVSFFPQLVAGPIERAETLLPQIVRPRRFDLAQISDGLWLILLGFVKKLVIADRLGQIADLGFTTDRPAFGLLPAVVFVVAFAFQIYGDFSGYSDIARGVAKLMGFELMVNFRKPYLVADPSAFWRHWHISLSTWLRDYLYIPLGGNRGGEAKTYRNLMVTMLLGGLWHGAGWAFVIWGLYHGTLLAAHRFWTSRISHRLAWPGGVQGMVEGQTVRALPVSVHRAGIALADVVRVVAFFALTCLGWLFFRVGTVASGVQQARLVGNYLGRLGAGADAASAAPYLPALVLLGALALWFQHREDEMERFSAWRLSRQVLGAVGALVLIAVFGVFEGATFIYFQF